MRQQYSKRMTTTLKSADCKPRSCKSINMQQPVIQKKLFCCKGKLVPSLRSRRLEVAGERENGHARGRHARGEGASSPLACLLLVRPFFLEPTTSKRLLGRLEKTHFINWACLDWAAQLKNWVSVSSFCKGPQNN